MNTRIASVDMSSLTARDASTLEHFPLFEGIDPIGLAAIRRAGELVRVSGGDRVLTQGMPAEHVFLLITGGVSVKIAAKDGREVTVKLFHAPAVFGEMEALTRTSWIETVTVIRPGIILKLATERFETILDQHPRAARRLLTDVCLRFRTSAKNQGHLAFDNVETRIAAMMLSYIRLYGVRVRDGVQIATELTQEGLAQSIAATRKSVARTFVRWRADGLIAQSGSFYIVRDEQELKRLAGEDPATIDHRLSLPRAQK